MYNGFYSYRYTYLIEEKLRKTLYINCSEDSIIEDAYIFLRGVCHIFAYELSKTYNYDIYELYDDNDKYLHTFCLCEFDNNTYYIDVRGITNDEQLFVSEFGLKDASNIKRAKKDKDGCDFIDEATSFAKYLIGKHKKYYDIHKINQHRIRKINYLKISYQEE